MKLLALGAVLLVAILDAAPTESDLEDIKEMGIPHKKNVQEVHAEDLGGDGVPPPTNAPKLGDWIDEFVSYIKNALEKKELSDEEMKLLLALIETSEMPAEPARLTPGRNAGGYLSSYKGVTRIPWNYKNEASNGDQIKPVVPKRHITSWENTDGSMSYRLLAITDLDKKAKADAKDTWKAITREGNLTLKKDLKFEIKWEEQERDHELKGYLNYKGRAMEMSDIVEFGNRRLTVDDKTGLLYDITSGKAIPWVFLNSGPGNTTSGMKVEWLTEKDGLLYAGGHGSEYRSTTTGEITSMDPMWIKTISKTGEVKSVNWFWEFSRIRNATNHPEPGYLTHEAVQWSEVHRKWFFLPRKASKTAYNETEDETKGCQLLITADENFENIVVKCIRGVNNNERGYSAFDFIPGSWDTLMVALKSEEVGDSTKSYVTVLDINGTVFLKDEPLDGDYKFEGIYFI